MAWVRELDELEVRVSFGPDQTIQLDSVALSYEQYPTPLQARDGRLVRPPAAVQRVIEQPKLFHQAVISWLDSRPAQLPAELEQAIWDLLVSPVRAVMAPPDRITLRGALSFELASALPARADQVVCVRLSAAPRAPASLPLSVSLLGVEPSSRLSTSLLAQEQSVKLRTNSAEPSAILHIGGDVNWSHALSQPCRLLCVQLENGDPWSVLERLKNAPAQAILVASGEADAFFAEIYRKILHDEPLDRALIAATPRPLVALGLRPGGETALLLSRIIAEQSGLLEAPPISYPEEKPLPATQPLSVGKGGLGSITEESVGRRVTRGVSKSLPESASESAFEAFSEAFESLESEPPDLTANRALSEHYSRALQPKLADFAQELANATTNPFSMEDHSLREFDELANRSLIARHVNDTLTNPEQARNAVRYTQAWFESNGDQVRRALEPAAEITLKLQIAAERREGAAHDRFPMEDVARFFKDQSSIPLEIELYGAAKDWLIVDRARSLQLPAVGASDIVDFGVTPLQSGPLRLRVCVYHRNQLLQSMLLVAWVGDLPVGQKPLSVELDYLASATFLELAERRQPVLHIFENEADSTHWIGTRAANAAQGQLYELPKDSLKADLVAARDALTKAHETCSDRFSFPDPKLDRREDRETQLIELAREGFKLYTALFANNTAGPGAAPAELASTGGLISVARLRGEAPAIPWQMIYDRPLYPSSQSLALCPHALANLAAGKFASCAAACQKPDSKGADEIVCPLGFWGLRHHIEQPLDLVARPTAGVDVDDAAIQLFFSKVGDVISAAAGLRIGFNASLPSGEGHVSRLGSSAVRGKLAAAPAEHAGANIRAALREGERALFYFYCHGQYDTNARFFLEIGATDRLGAADLTRNGPARPFLAVLNVCNSVDARSDQIQALLTALRNLGALGVISTETKVHEALASEFGERLVTKLGQGITVGEAFFDLRWEFLSEACDSSAFVYTLNGPAALRFVD